MPSYVTFPLAVVGPVPNRLEALLEVWRAHSILPNGGRIPTKLFECVLATHLLHYKLPI